MIRKCINCDNVIHSEKDNYEIGVSLGEYWCSKCASKETETYTDYCIFLEPGQTLQPGDIISADLRKLEVLRIEVVKPLANGTTFIQLRGKWFLRGPIE